MKKINVLIAVILVSASCSTQTEQQEPMYSGVLKEHNDNSIKPGDDFMAHVNGTWINNTEIPSDKASYGVGYELYEDSQEDVRTIIQDLSESNTTPGSDEQKVGDLFKSYIDTLTRNEKGIEPLLTEFEKIDAISNLDEIASYFAYANKFGYSVPIGLDVNQDLKDPSKYVVYVEQSGLGLPEREYYLKDDEGSKEIQEKYINHIQSVFTLTNLSNPEESANSIYKLEKSIAERHLEKEKLDDYAALYNLVSTDSLEYILSDFNWKNFLTEAGIEQQSHVVVMMTEYLNLLKDVINNTSLDDWKTYLKWGVIGANSTYLNSELDDASFNFYNKTLYGVQAKQPMWKRAVSQVNNRIGEIVGKVYVKRHFPEKAKERMMVMVNNLMKAYEMSIKDLDWMTDSTKSAALDKLSKFTPKIGYPDKWKDYSSLTIERDNLFQNIKNARLYKYNFERSKLGNEIDRGEWFMNPQVVNAYYNPLMNEIVFPAAILQPPLFDMNADDAVNYGAIGAVIGHEIGHGFDDAGSTFDGDGKLRNWWTETDLEEFKKRTQALVDQYDSYEALPGLFVNGEFTLGENIGDLGGLSIALKAYQLSLNGQEAPVLDSLSGIQRFFMGYAQSWRSKARDKAVRVQINTDPHSPAQFRVNGIVRNIPEFYDAFNVSAEDSLYLAPEERVKIW